MPKDPQVGFLSRRNRATVKAPSYLRFSMSTSSPKNSEKHDQTRDVDALDKVEMDFSAMRLDSPNQAEGAQSAGFGKDPNPKPQLGVLISQTQFPCSSPTRPTEPVATAPQRTPCNVSARNQSLGLGEQGSLDNAALQRRILVLEHRERTLKSEIKIGRRAIATFASEAEGALRLLKMAEERLQAFDHIVEKLKDDNNRYRSWWLSENSALRDLLGFVANQNDPMVVQIASSSRLRSSTFSSYAQQ